MDDKQLYRTIAAEIAGNQMDPARWTQAFADADGDREKARAIYIRLRYQDLAQPAAGVGGADQTAALRGQLAEALERNGRESLYRRLGLRADATDQEVGEAVRGIRAHQQGPDAEVRYAIEILGEPESRTRYDRSLAAGMGFGPDARHEEELQTIEETEPPSVFLRWWATRKVTLLVASIVVMLLGTMLLPFYQTGAVREHLRSQAELEKERLEQAQQVSEQRAEQMRLSEQRRARRQQSQEARQQRYEQERFSSQVAAEQRQREQARRAEERRQARDAQQSRYTAEQARRQAQREATVAEAKAAREAAYWSCFNDAMDRGDSAYAHARCGRLRY